MQHTEGLSPRQMGEFLKASQALRFSAQGRAQVYQPADKVRDRLKPVLNLLRESKIESPFPPQL